MDDYRLMVIKEEYTHEVYLSYSKSSYDYTDVGRMDKYQRLMLFKANLRDVENKRTKRRDTGRDDCGINAKKETGKLLSWGFHRYLLPGGKLDRIMSHRSLLPRAATQPTTSQSHKEIPVVQEKYKLVAEEMRTHCPEVNLLQGKTDTIILKGLEKDVESGAVKLNELINKVLEKRVSLPPDLITFIKSSGAITKYQTHLWNFRNPVTLEVGSDLVLFSLSSEALGEALAAIEKDLSVEIVKLQDAVALPPHRDRLVEILNKAKDEENCGERRVDVHLIPGSSGTSAVKVRLVGYSKNVNKLKEIVHDYQMSQVITQEGLNLCLPPELVDCFDQILQLIGMNPTEVTLKVSHVPNPCVLVSGPRCWVQETKKALDSALTNLTFDRLILDGPQAQRYFQEEGKVGKELVQSSSRVIIVEKEGVYALNANTRSQSSTESQPPATRWHDKPHRSVAVSNTRLEMKLGRLEDQQVNVLVVPMLNRQLESTEIGRCLLTKGGDDIKRNFDVMATMCPLDPGDVMQVDGPPTLGCFKIFFIECLPWDGVQGQSVQALGNGLTKCLDLCVEQGWSSVALPVIGAEVTLKYPWRKAFHVLTDTIDQFGSSGSLSTIHIVIEPDPDSEWYLDVCRHLNLDVNQGGQGPDRQQLGSIYRCLTSDLDDVTMTVGGGVELQVVFGDITNETTDAVVNTTDFTHFDSGVCKDILSVAGHYVEETLRMAKVDQGAVFTTNPASFPCKAILHVCGGKDADAIEQLVCRIIQHCESFGYKSVAIPAISAGAGGLDPGVVAQAILRGIKTATSSTSLLCLTTIRLVLINIKVFSTFKKKTLEMFPPAVTNTVSVLQLLHAQQQQQLSVCANIDLSVLHTSPAIQQSVFLIVGDRRENVDDAMAKLRNLYQAHCSTKTFTKEDLAELTQDDIEDLKQLVETQGLHVEESGQGGWTVSGFKDGVNQVVQMLHTITLFRREMRTKEEKDLYAHVSWCIRRHRGHWERLPKTASHKLENGNVVNGIVDARRITWTVDLQKMRAKRQGTGQKAKLKRLQNQPAFTFPLNWDVMTPGKNLQVVPLKPSSAEYRSVQEAFNQTSNKTIMKIARVQNGHLRQAYEVQKNLLSEKNRAVGAGEKILYHGTSPDNCDAIIKYGFNRSFSGRNATTYGHGTYFAVNASYSAHHTYSPPADDGFRVMFVARVLTGVYTWGDSNMRVPPPINSLRPYDRFDSAVDRMDNPNLYVVFNDNQAYPDYLITFC